jgi:hypothetical protein
VETPWLVSKATSDITKPIGAMDYTVSYAGKSKVFVASGEQGFLYNINKGFLPTGKFQTITPCMRYETFDDYHQKYFMKNELIYILEPLEYTQDHVNIEIVRMMSMVVETLSTISGIDEERFQIVDTGEMSSDIELDGIEIGSYGYRMCAFAHWIYGTGIAEPRFSRICNNGVNK